MQPFFNKIQFFIFHYIMDTYSTEHHNQANSADTKSRAAD
jgi:hypothetical protein